MCVCLLGVPRPPVVGTWPLYLVHAQVNPARVRASLHAGAAGSLTKTAGESFIKVQTQESYLCLQFKWSWVAKPACLLKLIVFVSFWPGGSEGGLLLLSPGNTISSAWIIVLRI